MSEAPAPRARRLPTKTRSGIITLPPRDDLEDDLPRPTNPPPAICKPAAMEVAPEAKKPDPEPGLVPSPSNPTPEEDRSSTGSNTTSSTSQPEAVPEPAPSAPAPKQGGYGGPKTVPKPAPLKTGPLNATTTPVVKALPVKRRGSYQSLKRRSIPNQSNIKSEDEPSIMSILKKNTHWERFGTIMVQLCIKSGDGDSEQILQFLSAEGYDTEVALTQEQAVAVFSSRDIFPDIVLVDCTIEEFKPLKLIQQLQAKNPTVAIMCIGSDAQSSNKALDVVTVLQGGATDFMTKPLDLNELVARLERHVQRQHGIKLELETALEDAKAIMAQVASAAAIGDIVHGRSNGPPGRKAGLNSVAETDFEEQITELTEENCRLGARLEEMELQNKVLEEALSEMNLKIDRSSLGVDGHISQVSVQSSLLQKRVEELEVLMRQL